MDKPVSVRLPSVLNSEKSDKKGKSRRSKSDSRGSDVGIATVVPGPSGSKPRRSSSVSSRSSRSSSAQVGRASRRSSSAKSARVVSVRESLQSRGASDEVIEFVDQAHRPGTKKFIVPGGKPGVSIVLTRIFLPLLLPIFNWQIT